MIYGSFLRRISIEEIVGDAGITKGGFFYHFDGKNHLARCLIKRFLKNDIAEFTAIADRAHSLTEDPLQRFLLFLKLLAEALEDLPGAHPGCLVAAFAYEAEQFDDEVRELNAKVLSDRSILPNQLLQYRNYIRLVFGDA